MRNNFTKVAFTLLIMVSYTMLSTLSLAQFQKRPWFLPGVNLDMTTLASSAALFYIADKTIYYPNGTSSSLQLPGYALDMSGKILQQKQIPTSEGSQKLDLEMPELANGMYYYRWTTYNKVFTGKFVKE